ncbi:MAG: hypothetical protein EPO21_15710 [Chloroflexota bacterium]|nr:MAG: hypothetical protein EPO21_15710 [Chloroflexota bacterium]
MGSKREIGVGPSAEGWGLEKAAKSTTSTTSTPPTRSRELIEVLRRIRSHRAGGSALPSSSSPSPRVELSPGCAYGVQSRQILDDLKKDVDEVKLRLNGLIFLVVGAVVVDVVIRLVR